ARGAPRTRAAIRADDGSRRCSMDGRRVRSRSARAARVAAATVTRERREPAHPSYPRLFRNVSSIEHLRVELRDSIYERCMSELPRPLVTRRTEPRAKRGISGQAQQRRAQCTNVARRDQQTFLIVAHQLRQRTVSVSNHRRTSMHRLDHRTAERLSPRRYRRDVAPRVQCRGVLALTTQLHAPRDAEIQSETREVLAKA